MVASLQQRFGRYLRKRRGKLTYEQFARRVGVSKSTLQRLELGQQNFTITTLDRLMRKLKCTAAEALDGSSPGD